MMKKLQKLTLILLLASSFLLTGCDAQKILDVVGKIANGVTQAMPAIQNVVNTFQGIFSGNNADAADQTANNTTAEVAATNTQAAVNVTNPNQENIAGTGATAATAAAPTVAASQAEAALANYKGGQLSPSAFANLFGPIAQAASQRSGVPASIILAQAALETGWGKSSLGDAKNLFGIKGTGPAGSISMPTKEFINGRMVTVQANFRKYNSWLESIEDHNRLLTTSSRYAKCMAVRNNPDQFARELQKAGYATDPAYASKLINIMKSNNFYRFNT